MKIACNISVKRLFFHAYFHWLSVDGEVQRILMVAEIMSALQLQLQPVCPPPFRKDERQKEHERITSATWELRVLVMVSCLDMRISFVFEGTRRGVEQNLLGSICQTRSHKFLILQERCDHG